MNTLLILLLIIFAVVALVFALALFSGGSVGGLFSGASVKGNIRNIVASQRQGGGFASSAVKRNPRTIFDAAAEARVEKTASSRLTLRKKLKYAQWKIPPVAYYLCVFALSFVSYAIVSRYFSVVIQFFSLFVGPLLMGWLLNRQMDKRFKEFDADYPAFLLSLVGLIKTGMNIMSAIEAAAQSLEEGSLMKHEVGMMMERLRFGVSEDKSIGSFGEDIFHPEIELFVQALLLSRRVGGNLSDTLDRLSKQIRKRQFFRNSANAAVGMQRGSIWIIIFILVGMEGYLLTIQPDMVLTAIHDEMGWMVWQTGLIMIILGIFWVRQVTKIRV